MRSARRDHPAPVRKRGGAPPPIEPEVDFAVNLHRLVVSNLPMRTEVDSIPQRYSAIFRIPFPISPTVPLAAVLTHDFGHLFAVTQNRSGQVFVEPKLGPDLPLEEVARMHQAHIRALVAPQPPIFHSNNPPVRQVPMPMPQPAPQRTVTGNLTPREEKSVLLMLKGLHKVLLMHPELGESDSISNLRDSLLDAFFDIIGLPMVCPATQRSVDPIELLQKNQGKVFTRIIEEPVTGKVSVRAIAENPQFGPQGSLSSGTVGTPVPRTGFSAMLQLLREQILANSFIVESALNDRHLAQRIADRNLWQQAMETLINQEKQATSILNSLFR